MRNTNTIYANSITFMGSLVPVFKSCPPCAICMPKYAALFAFFGLELADYSQYLIPIMLASMLISLAIMYRQVKTFNLPPTLFYTALTASLTLIVSKFYFDSTPLSFIAMGTLLACIIKHHLNMKTTCCQTC